MFDGEQEYNATFTNVKKIGRGKFGTVFQVQHTKSGQYYAAKRVK